MYSLVQALEDCRRFLPESFLQPHARLFHEEHLRKLAARLEKFRDEVPDAPPPPRFEAECTPPFGEVFAPFAPFMDSWAQAEESRREEMPRELAETLLAAGCGNILIMLGQRLTSASLSDASAIPRPKPDLLASASVVYSAKLTAGARALTKHVNRNSGEFWGQVCGSEEDKNRHAREVIERILDGTTWWNVFFHYKHEIVYEARAASGHGSRWGKDGMEFIGFLEPFLSES